MNFWSFTCGLLAVFAIILLGSLVFLGVLGLQFGLIPEALVESLMQKLFKLEVFTALLAIPLAAIWDGQSRLKGSLALLAQVLNLRQAWWSRRWPAALGQVKEGSGTSSVSYDYSVGGRRFSGSGEALESAPGTQVLVFYDPKHPETSVLVPGLRVGPFVDAVRKALAGLVFLAVGGTALAMACLFLYGLWLN